GRGADTLAGRAPGRSQAGPHPLGGSPDVPVGRGADMSRPAPLDQADGLRRLFAHARVQFIPVASNPHVAFGGVMLERLCAAFGEHGRHTLVRAPGEHAPAHAEMATMELAECSEGLSPQVSYLAARRGR